MRITLAVLALAVAGPAWSQTRIVADTLITASLIRQVAGDLAEVQVLLPQGASVHHHQMRPSDARGLQDAALLVWTGPELTPWLDRAVQTVAADVAQVRLLAVPGTHLRGFGNDPHDDHGHDHDLDTVDPHAWLDPDNARLWVSAIADELGQVDPANAPRYAENAGATAQRIADLDRRLRSRLAPHADARIVVFHDAYGYFTDHFGLPPAIAVSLGDASTPSAARLSEIRDRIATSGAACAFPEYGTDPRLIQTVIDGTAVRMGAELAPEGRVARDNADDLYGAMMTGMADTIGACLEKTD